MTGDVLYLSGVYCNGHDDIVISLESYISLFVYHYCDLSLEICFIDSKDADYFYEIPTKSLSGITFTVNEELANSKTHLSKELSFLLPAVVIESEQTTIAGLCAVLRYVIKSHVAQNPDHTCKNLLGFRGGCLVACTESSIWTKFCELQIPNSVKEVFKKIRNGEPIDEVPESLILLEAHFKRPVRTHNILKRKIDIAKQVKKQNSSNDPSHKLDLDSNFTLYDQNYSPVDKNDIQRTLQNMAITEKNEKFCLDHCYLEGIDLTLADMIVLPCVHYLLSHLPSQASDHLQCVTKWFKKMFSHTLVSKAADKIGMSLDDVHRGDENDNVPISVPNVDQTSLYKRDPSHTKMKCKHQSPDKIISLLSSAKINPVYTANYCSKLQWDQLPPLLHPAQGDLPEKRVDRKCQQLESIVTAVLNICSVEQTIVEFCAGGRQKIGNHINFCTEMTGEGHVGLLLAHFLPSCKVYLIENKESSMMRAKNRASALNLKNVYFYQCNLDYFVGNFDVGVSLHACGVATDLVMQQCISKKASFVCCPCCYGNIQDTHIVSYPLSERFRRTDLTKKDYRLLAHFADRNEVNTPTAEQGEICMGLVDTDRALYAEEQSYKTILTTMQPIACSPKHNLLIGISRLHCK